MQKEFKKTNFSLKEGKPDFVKNEETVLAYWNEIKAFEQQLEKTKNNPHYTFYDGPPFATGTPHYGHICAGTIKDVITRYASMNGFHVERKFGWDCHGLPVEYEIDKKLGIKNRNEILEMGIDKYNQECRSIVMRYSSEWRDVVNRLGRWIDFDDDYKTMDRSFMESVWWVFRQIFDKGLVYRGCKIMPYSTKCLTVLSNFEASQKYRNIQDPSVVISFPLKDDPEVSFLAWTTTPWTLPSNLALAVNPNFTYVKIKDLKRKRVFIMAKCRLVELFKTGAEFSDCEGGTTQNKNNKKNNKKKKKKKKNKKKNQEKKEGKDIKEKKEQKELENEFEILEEYKGKDLEGKEYEPLFNYYYDKMKPKGCFKVVCGDYVTSDSGTGIVHTAPAFGEEDYRVCRKYKIIAPEDPCVSINESGEFIDLIEKFKGMYIKDADPLIMEDLKSRQRLIKKATITHSYPMCWRSGSPLIYKAVSTWFIRVEALKEKLLVNNLKSRWVPEFAQTGRFQKWLENVNDWCFSRNRFWGNPIPLWVSEDFEEIVCVGSVEELKKLANIPDDVKIDDLHRENLDHITIPSKKGKGTLRRIDETFDCWFESGSMPYASIGYPFKINEEEFLKRFPADFIGEGLDQTRGWFYTLNVIGTALFDTCPYKNLIVNGIVCAKDGEKMSKSKKNYPDPMIVVNELGADPLRLYLMNSPLVKGQELSFKEAGIKAVVKDIFFPWYYLCSLLLQEINRYENLTQTKFEYKEELFTENSSYEFENLLDKWILAKTQSLLGFVRQEFDHYRLSTVLKQKLKYLDHLGNWYVNMNKLRFRGENGPQDAYLAINVFFYCFFSSITMMAPYVPFIVEYFYQDMKKVINDKSKLNEQSIHFLRIPHPIKKFEDSNLVDAVEVFQKLMSSMRKERELKKVNKKQPLSEISIFPRNKELMSNLQKLETYIQEQGNLVKVNFSNDYEKYMKFNLLPNFAVLSSELGSKLRVVVPLIKKLNEDQVKQFLKDKTLTLKYNFNGQEESITLDEERVLFKSTLIAQSKDENKVIAGEVDFAYEMDFTITPELKLKGVAREVINRIQRSRKSAGVKIQDRIVISIKLADEQKLLKEVFDKELEFIRKKVRKPVVLLNDDLISTPIYNTQTEVGSDVFDIFISLGGIQLVKDQLGDLTDKQMNLLRKLMTCYDPYRLGVLNELELNLNGKALKLEKNKHYKVVQ